MSMCAVRAAMRLLRSPVFWLGLGAMGALEAFGLYGFYQRFSWYDKFLHLMGGLWVGIAVQHLLEEKTASPNRGRKRDFLFTIAGVMFVGASWEVFQTGVLAAFGHFAAYLSHFQESVNDSAADLFADFIGGTLAFFIFTRILRRQKIYKPNSKTARRFIGPLLFYCQRNYGVILYIIRIIGFPRYSAYSSAFFRDKYVFNAEPRGIKRRTAQKQYIL